MGGTISQIEEENKQFSYQIQSVHANSPASTLYKSYHDCKEDIRLSVAIQWQKLKKESNGSELSYKGGSISHWFKSNEYNQDQNNNHLKEHDIQTNQTNQEEFPRFEIGSSYIEQIKNNVPLKFPNMIIPFLDHIISLDTIPVSIFESQASFYKKYLERSVGQSICLTVKNIMTGAIRNVWLKPEWKIETSKEDEEIILSYQNEQDMQTNQSFRKENDAFNSEVNESQDEGYNVWLGLNCRYTNLDESKYWIWRILNVLEDTEASRHHLKINDFILGVNNSLFSSNDRWPRSVEKILVYRWENDIIEELNVEPNRELGCEIALGISHSSSLFERWRYLWTQEVERISRESESKFNNSNGGIQLTPATLENLTSETIISIQDSYNSYNESNS